MRPPSPARVREVCRRLHGIPDAISLARTEALLTGARAPLCRAEQRAAERFQAGVGVRDPIPTNWRAEGVA